MQEYFAIANREKMRLPCPRRDRGPAAKPPAERRWREENAASGAKLEMARCKNKFNRAGNPGGSTFPSTLPVMSSSNFPSAKSLRFRGHSTCLRAGSPPEGQKTTGDSNAAVFSYHVESYYQVGSRK